jgi:putative oxidoreductase
MYETETRPGLYVPALSGLYRSTERLAYPLMRFVVGAFLVPHGMQKLFGFFGGDISATAGFFAKFGIEPALPLAYVVGFVELVGGTFIALGLFTRPAAAAVVVLLLVAVLKVHLGNGFFWTKAGFEYPALWGLMALAIVLRGGGPMSLDRKLGKEF